MSEFIWSEYRVKEVRKTPFALSFCAGFLLFVLGLFYSFLSAPKTGIPEAFLGLLIQCFSFPLLTDHPTPWGAAVVTLTAISAAVIFQSDMSVFADVLIIILGFSGGLLGFT